MFCTTKYNPTENTSTYYLSNAHVPVLLQMPILVNCHEIGWVTGSTRDLMSPSSSAMMELVKKADVFNDPKICSLWKKGKLKNIIVIYRELWSQSSLSIFIPKLSSRVAFTKILLSEDT